MCETDTETGPLSIQFPGVLYQSDSQSTGPDRNAESLMFTFPSPFENVHSAVNLEAHRSLHHVMGRNVLFVALRDVWQGTKKAWPDSAITYSTSLIT